MVAYEVDVFVRLRLKIIGLLQRRDSEDFVLRFEAQTILIISIFRRTSLTFSHFATPVGEGAVVLFNKKMLCCPLQRFEVCPALQPMLHATKQPLLLQGVQVSSVCVGMTVQRRSLQTLRRVNPCTCSTL